MKKLLFTLILFSTQAFASETVDIRVIYEEKVAGQTFRDAIYYKDMAEYEAKKADGSHEAEKLARVARYDDAIKNPPPYVPPTKEQLLAELATLDTQRAEISGKVAEIDKKGVKEGVLDEVSEDLKP